MDLALSEEQEMLRDGLARFVSDSYDFEKRRAVLRSQLGFNADHWKTFAELGWLGLAFPPEAGGLGCSFVEISLVMEAFGAALVVEPYASNVVLAGRVLERSDNAALRNSTLSAIADGNLRVALAHGEQQIRYQLDSVRTTARAANSGYTLQGTKVLVLDGPSADRFIVSAQLGADIALFLLDRQTPGVTVRPYRLVDDTHAADVSLDNVQVQEGSLLLRGNVIEVLEEAYDRFILAKVAETLGAAERVLQISGDYVQSRVQFGQALIKFQATQHRLAEMFVEVQELRSILYCGMSQIDAEARARRRAVSAAKVVAANTGRIVGGLGIQMHGGIGVTEEYSVGHYFKKFITTEKLFGDTDYHLARLAASS